MIYTVELIILNKDGVRDPEGETIQQHAVEKFDKRVLETRAGKYLLFKVETASPEDAELIIRKIAQDARLYNPIVHKIVTRVIRAEDGSH
jgi:phosphoribosylformylglycinamidine (FGAM) synthase PurS component